MPRSPHRDDHLHRGRSHHHEDDGSAAVLMRGLLAALVVLVSGAAAAVEPGVLAPDLTLPRLDAASGTVSLAGLKGKVVYVDFWASWCVPCRLSMPVLDPLYRRHAQSGFAVVGVNKDTSAADA